MSRSEENRGSKSTENVQHSWVFVSLNVRLEHEVETFNIEWE